MRKIVQSSFFRYSALILVAVIATIFLFPGSFRGLFSGDGFLPHATCYLRNPGVIRLHVISDLLIGAAYVSISVTLGYLVWKASENIPFHWMFLAFGIFIISCGFTHFMEVWTVWQPVYWLAGYVKLISAVASVVTAIALFPLVPKVFRLIDAVKVSEQRAKDLAEAHAALARKNEELSEQKSELQAANDDLNAFSYSVAHDFRAPLRSMQGFAEMLKADVGHKLSNEENERLNKITTGATKLQTMLTELLEYSRLSRADMQLHPVNLQDAIQQGLDLIRVETDARKAKISIQSTDARVVGNQTALTHIVANLVSNAIKFVPRDSAPEVAIRVERRGARHRLSITDNGIGIAQEHQDRIFKIFERLHPDSRFAGSGIGLAIVYRATQKMGGELGLESSPGRGSTFWVELAAV